MSTPNPSPNANDNPYITFQAGVTAALRSWSALREAVQQEWGGSESTAKAEDLRSNIFTFFDGTTPNPKMSQEELEDNLLGYMEEEFGVVLEDGSERQVSDLICRMYEGCAKGDVALAQGVVQNAMAAEEALKNSNVKSVIQSGDGDDDMDDSDVEGGADEGMSDTAAVPVGGMEHNIANAGQPSTQQQHQQMSDATTNTATAAMAYASGTLFGGPPKPKKELPPPRQLGEAEPEKPKPVLDDDGFAPVVSKRKGGKNR